MQFGPDVKFVPLGGVYGAGQTWWPLPQLSCAPAFGGIGTGASHAPVVLPTLSPCGQEV
jgi:hypothetical protein